MIGVLYTHVIPRPDLDLWEPLCRHVVGSLYNIIMYINLYGRFSNQAEFKSKWTLWMRGPGQRPPPPRNPECMFLFCHYFVSLINKILIRFVCMWQKIALNFVFEIFEKKKLCKYLRERSPHKRVFQVSDITFLYELYMYYYCYFNFYKIIGFYHQFVDNSRSCSVHHPIRNVNFSNTNERLRNIRFHVANVIFCFNQQININCKKKKVS